uniref:RIIa domain-containing protein n=1 Tax=Plectus sambesii TaxID=2011161 RepID=A0A914V7I5_9BILA
MASGGEEAQLAQCQAYVQRHNVQQLVKDAIVQLCIHKPDNPITFLKEHFEKLEEQHAQKKEEGSGGIGGDEGECDSFVGAVADGGDGRLIGVVEVAARASVAGRPVGRMAYRFCAGWPTESHSCVSKNAAA